MYTQRGQEQIVDNDGPLVEIEEALQNTGKWLRMHADMEHDAENGICMQLLPDGRWLVGGLVIVDSFDNALELAA